MTVTDNLKENLKKVQNGLMEDIKKADNDLSNHFVSKSKKTIKIFAYSSLIMLITAFALAVATYNFQKGFFTIGEVPFIVIGSIFGGIMIIALVYIYIQALIFVHQDAKARHMNATLWVLICLFVPYLIGFLGYFLLRNPLPKNCSHCGSEIKSSDTFCSNCGKPLTKTCQKCESPIGEGVKFCSNCGSAV